jgi:hypothetical protein
MQPQTTVDLQSVLMGDLYKSDSQPRVADVKQVIDTLKDHVQPLTPVQVQAVGYLEYLQDRPIHGGKKPYKEIINRIRNDAVRVAPPGYYIRVIEALIPRTQHIDGQAAKTIKAEREGKA